MHLIKIECLKFNIKNLDSIFLGKTCKVKDNANNI